MTERAYLKKMIDPQFVAIEYAENDDMCISIYLSIHLSIYLSIYLFYLSIYLYIDYIYIFMYAYIKLYTVYIYIYIIIDPLCIDHRSTSCWFHFCNLGTRSPPAGWTGPCHWAEAGGWRAFFWWLSEIVRT